MMLELDLTKSKSYCNKHTKKMFEISWKLKLTLNSYWTSIFMFQRITYVVPIFSDVIWSTLLYLLRKPPYSVRIQENTDQE